MVDTLETFVLKAKGAGALLEAETIASVKSAAAQYEVAISARAADATGGDLVLSGVNRPKGGRLSILTNLLGNEVTLVPEGPWGLVENDVAPHDIEANSSRRRRSKKTGRFVAGGAVLAFGDGGFAASAHDTGGSKGSHPWEEGIAAVTPIVAAEFQAKVHETLQGIFD